MPFVMAKLDHNASRFSVYRAHSTQLLTTLVEVILVNAHCVRPQHSRPLWMSKSLKYVMKVDRDVQSVKAAGNVSLDVWIAPDVGDSFIEGFSSSLADRNIQTIGSNDSPGLSSRRLIESG